jgi:fatty acid desaturase
VAHDKVIMLEATATPDSSTQIAFRKLRQDLEKEGWWERDIVHEYTQLGLWASCVIGAALTASSVPFISIVLLSLSMTAAGWLGHDYVHGVDKFAFRMRNFAALAAGLLPTWWSDKHNKHHALTNEQGVDEDIATDPFLYQWAPDPANDSPLRKIQHYIFWIPFSFLFALWRVDSLKVAIDSIEQKRPNAKEEMYSLLIHYGVLLTLFPASVWIPAIFLSGLISALIVTPTHQSEELFEVYQPDWVTAQFQSTRNAVTTNPFSEWIWGGMQYQLEHHLFPSMPRNRYPQLKQRLQDFATTNNVPGGYRESGEFEILKMNWDLYRRVAQADPVPGAPSTRGTPEQQASIESTNSPANVV